MPIALPAWAATPTATGPAVAWVAMMLPAVLPVVRLYARAAAQGRAAPLPFFVAGYIAVWSTMAVPGCLAWRELEMPLAEGRTWVGVLAGASLLAAAVWQVTPLKAACLRAAELVARGGAVVCAALGAALLVDPSIITHLT